MTVFFMTLGIGLVVLVASVALILFLNWLLDTITERLGTGAGICAALCLVIGGVAMISYPLAVAVSQ